MADVIRFPSQDAMLDVSVVGELLRDLGEAFPGGARAKNPEGMLRTYRNHLAGVSTDAARGAVKSIIRNDERFPSVSRIVAAAHEWTRRNVASPEFQLRHDANRCQQCGESYARPERWRPMVIFGDASVPAGSLALTPDAEAVYLESYSRDVCSCHPPCKYVPDISADARERYDNRATMPIALLPSHDQYRILEQRTRKRGAWKASLPPTIASEATRIAAGAGV